jgi:predicted metal-dependent phosphoesterase TrpH
MPHPFSRWPVARDSVLGDGHGSDFAPAASLLRMNGLLTREVLGAVDMIEVMNSRTPFSGNLDAAHRLAELCGLPGTAGSDAHTAREIGHARTEMADFSDAKSFLAAMRGARTSGVKSSVFVHFASMSVKLRRKPC